VLELAAFIPPNTSKCEAIHKQMPVGSVVKVRSYSMTGVVLRIFHKWDVGTLINTHRVHIYILITTICLGHSRVSLKVINLGLLTLRSYTFQGFRNSRNNGAYVCQGAGDYDAWNDKVPEA
jgi:hypothetical protein